MELSKGWRRKLDKFAEPKLDAADTGFEAASAYLSMVLPFVLSLALLTAEKIITNYCPPSVDTRKRFYKESNPGPGSTTIQC